MQEPEKKREASADAYTGRPGGTPGRKRSDGGSAAAVVVGLVLVLGMFFASRPSAKAPHSSPPPSEAVAASPAAETPAAARPSSRPLYLGIGEGGGGRAEPEQNQPGTRYYGGFYDERVDGFPIVGDEMDGEVDGRPMKIAIKPSSRPGVKKAFVVIPRDGRPHTIVMLPVYDLGADGRVQVRDTIIDRGQGGEIYISASPVDTVVVRPGDPRRRLKLKD